MLSITHFESRKCKELPHMNLALLKNQYWIQIMYFNEGERLINRRLGLQLFFSRKCTFGDVVMLFSASEDSLEQ